MISILPFVFNSRSLTITSTIYVLLVTPVVFEITKRYELNKYGKMDMVESSIKH